MDDYVYQEININNKNNTYNKTKLRQSNCKKVYFPINNILNSRLQSKLQIKTTYLRLIAVQ